MTYRILIYANSDRVRDNLLAHAQLDHPGHEPVVFVDYIGQDVESTGLPGPALSDLLCDIRKGDIVIMNKLADMHVCGAVEIMFAVKRRGARLIFLDDAWGDTDRQVLADILVAHRLYQRAFRREINRSRMRQKAAGGRAMSSKPPWGWKKVWKNGQWSLEEHPPEQEIIRKVIDLYQSDYNMAEITRRMKKDGHLSRVNRPLCYASIRNIILKHKRSSAPPSEETIRRAGLLED